MKFQDKFYDIIDHNKCPSSEKSAEKCILRKSYFHHSEPRYAYNAIRLKHHQGYPETTKTCVYVLCEQPLKECALYIVVKIVKHKHKKRGSRLS